jgi:hypothetical protein
MVDILNKPTAYSREIGRTICGRLVEDETLREICRDPGMPAKPTVMRWLVQHEEFRKGYELAREMQFDDLFFESLTIIDAGMYVEKVRRNGIVVRVFDHDNFARAKLRCEIRRWVADRLPPKDSTVD